MLSRIGLPALVLLASASAARAVTFTVDRIDDQPAATACTAAPLDCSLRGAVAAANLTPGAPHTIVIPAGNYVLQGSSLSQLQLQQDMTLRGAGMDQTIIGPLDIDDVGRVINLFNVEVEIRDLTLQHGDPDDLVSGRGGCIQATGATLTLRRVRLRECEGTQVGGGVLAQSSTVEVIDSEIVDNVSGIGGGFWAGPTTNLDPPSTVTVSGTLIRDNQGPGVVVVDSSLTFTDSVIERNGGDGEEAGGLWVADEGSASLTRSQVRNNRGQVGGIRVDDEASLVLNSSAVVCNASTVSLEAPGGASIGATFGSNSTLTAINSTLSRNAGVGLSFFYASAPVLTNVTVADNGGPAAISGVASTVTHRNSIFDGPCSLFNGMSYSSGGGNVQNDSGCVGAAPGDQTVANLAIGGLGPYGGPTLSQVPRAESAAVGNGVPGFCPALDQRGETRSASCDSGAVERQGGDPEPYFYDGFECLGLTAWSSSVP